MTDDIINILLKKSYDIITEKANGKKIKRKEIYKILNRNIHIDKNLSKKIIKELEHSGLIFSQKREVLINKKGG